MKMAGHCNDFVCEQQQQLHLLRGTFILLPSFAIYTKESKAYVVAVTAWLQLYVHKLTA